MVGAVHGLGIQEQNTWKYSSLFPYVVICQPFGFGCGEARNSFSAQKCSFQMSTPFQSLSIPNLAAAAATNSI
jgi:hypothetical protein